MTFITLFSSEHGFVATDQRVFSPEELKPLSGSLEQAQLLEQHLSEQLDRETAVFEAARENGYHEGLNQGRTAATEQLTIEVRQLHEQHVQAVAETRSSCAELAVDIVRKIAGNVNSEQWLAAQARQAAEDVVDQPSIKLRVHSSHADAVRGLLADTPRTSIHSVVGDDSLSDQTCILDTGNGQIDISLDTQLSSILNLLTDGQGPAGAPGV
ncbi:MAG: FliH/SctL family protein [Granulosicoccus sp.]